MLRHATAKNHLHDEGGKFATKHGLHNSPEHWAWGGMVKRCFNPAHNNWHNYGGRGITVCDRWLGDHGFENFLEDMGFRPSREHSLDRIDVNGNYTPENCRWSSRKEQQRNRRNNRLLTHDGRTATVVEWSEITGIKEDTILKRLVRGLSTSEALTRPVRDWGRG